MLIKTKFFNEIEIDENSIVHFINGIPGFHELLEYILIHPEDDLDFKYLQSVENRNVCFIVVPPALIIGNYDIEISDEIAKRLEIAKPEDVELYAILTIPDDIRLMTANLKAPIIINSKNRKAIQEILDDEAYNVRHRIIKEDDASC